MSLCSDHIDDDKNENFQLVKLIVSLIMISFYIWALILALKVSDKEHRVLHVTLALLTGPLYVLSYYLGMMKQDNMIE